MRGIVSKAQFPFLILIALFVAWTVFIYRIPPADIIEILGVRNGYLITFVLAFLGGISTFVPIPYYLFVMTFAAGGLNPFLLGFVAGIGLFLGDSTSYVIAYHGREIIPSRIQKTIDRAYEWSLSHPKWLASLAIFSYGAFIPLPDDLVVMPLGFIHYPYWRLMIPMTLGNIVFNTLAAFIGLYTPHLF